MSSKPMSEVDVLDRILNKLTEVEALEKLNNSRRVKDAIDQVRKTKEKVKGVRDKAIRQFKAGE